MLRFVFDNVVAWKLPCKVKYTVESFLVNSFENEPAPLSAIFEFCTEFLCFHYEPGALVVELAARLSRF